MHKDYSPIRTSKHLLLFCCAILFSTTVVHSEDDLQLQSKQNNLVELTKVNGVSTYCTYTDENGKLIFAPDIEAIPVRFRKTADCNMAMQAQTLAAPEDISLGTNERRTSIQTPLGMMHARWNRTAGNYFSKTPNRAIQDAAQAVSRAVSHSAFPTKLKNAQEAWQIVFLDQKLPESQIPSDLIKNCHPGWMTPPKNIYIIAQRVAGICSSKDTLAAKPAADSQLAAVLIHEMGHAVEFQLMGPKTKSKGPDKMQSEGFATWFEGIAGKESRLLSSGRPGKSKEQLAQESLRKWPDRFDFNGSAQDYARASMYFKAIENKRGLQGVLQMYKVMEDKGLSFEAAILDSMRWNNATLQREIKKAAGL